WPIFSPNEYVSIILNPSLFVSGLPEFGQGLFKQGGVRQHAVVPCGGALHERDAVALYRVADDDGGNVAVGVGDVVKCLNDLLHAIAVYLHDVPAEGLKLFAERFQFESAVKLLGGGAQAHHVSVDESHQVSKLVVRGQHSAFPDGSFVALAVAEHGENVMLVPALLYSEG